MNEVQIPFTYPWDQAPEWANWAATDGDGSAWWYERKPCLDEDGGYSWGPDKDEDLVSSAQQIYGDSHPQAAIRWKESLQQRPQQGTPMNEEMASSADALTTLRNLTPAILDALSTQDLEDFSRLCNLWNNYSAELLDRRLYQ
jgi:hypothetical protein